MQTYRIQHPPTHTDFLTTDFMDVWAELEKIPDGYEISIKTQEMTVPEFDTEIKKLAVLNLTIKTPWKNGDK